MHPPSIVNLRKKSLLRGALLVLGSLILAFVWAGYPEAHANPRLILPVIVAFLGTADTMRCLRLKWSFYHAGVMLLIYMDIMALAMILFLLLYPYDGWLM
ncbi:hypothetical protein ACPOL_6693 [Acidisarcina polymorpha]|uniref:Uncharacterized protein n=1 Tax=Acidisarcina polymorpha TaxID=2211140 RepID=A0A2Z5GB94_9BACT|nr:permease [Acidisarcina polymorpha]AXC15905.1 hypothetical protein ACPOL_6693 [Acidisarcina polymorpha]